MTDTASPSLPHSAAHAPSRTFLAYDIIEPEVVRELREVTRRLADLISDARLRELILVRVSQLNGCAFCIDYHAREALAAGESAQRLIGLSAWVESDLFAPRECAALGWADAVTQLPEAQVQDTTYAALLNWFTETEVVRLTLAIALANAWNRIAGSFRRQPTPWKKSV